MFAELHCKTHYSFLTGASSPEELVYRAKAQGYRALAITDECSLAGVVKAYKAGEECNFPIIIGSEFMIDGLPGPNKQSTQCKLVLLAPNRTAYSEISALITKGRRRSKKGEYSLSVKDLRFGLQHSLAIFLPGRLPFDKVPGYVFEQATSLKKIFPQRLWLGVELFFRVDDQMHYLCCEQIASSVGINMLACNDVLMASRSCQPLQDVVTAIRLNTSVDRLGVQRQYNAEKYLKPLSVIKHQYPQPLIEETLRVASLCHFCLRELRYEYPHEVVPRDYSPMQYLSELSYRGAGQRWPQGVPDAVNKQLQYELSVIEELEYAYYFLTIYDIVAFARSQNIFCQGRGSAANSAVCYCLFITEVDPSKSELLFERFISKERNEPPDIDVDFENARREEVIQYIYAKYSRKRTALVATVITYRRKSAIRDVGKALGLPLALIDELSRSLAWWDSPEMLADRFAEQDLSADSYLSHLYLSLVQEILGVPRHLSQHVGGFLITESPTSTLVPIENAAMEGRTVIQWDKDDIEILGLLKVDVLALGMLTAIHKAVDLINRYSDRHYDMGTIPREDPAVYDLLCRGDSVGVFQVESRAQMAMLPRLKPRCFYDLVVQVAIVRPGPIQGDMVHPYLKRRSGEEPEIYPNEAVKAVLQRTLGVPIFQEQVIKLTMVAAGFTGGEADQLRRAMASWGKNGNLYQFRDKLIDGMLSRGYSPEFAQNLFKQLMGFGSYGFPESHSASFAILVYLSAWIKCHHPAAFYCALLNSQPMGFYSPSQLVQDARRHQVPVLPVSAQASDWDHTLEQRDGRIALRLGMRLVSGVPEAVVQQLMTLRRECRFAGLGDFKRRLALPSDVMRCLVEAGAFRDFHHNRREASWHSLRMAQPFVEPPVVSARHLIREPTAKENMLSDYRMTGLSLNCHPMRLLRRQKPFNRCVCASQLSARRNKSLVEIAGVVTGRQRPGTASGVLFMTLEDETGSINVIIWKKLQQHFRQQVLNGRILYIKGTLETRDNVVHVVAGYFEDHSDKLPEFAGRSRDFH